MFHVNISGNILGVSAISKLVFWDIQSNTHLKEISFEGIICDFVFSPDQNVVIFIADDKFAHCHNLQTGERICSRKFNKRLSAIDMYGDKVAISDKFGDVFLVHVSNLETDRDTGHLSIVSDVVFSPDGQYIATADKEFKVRISRNPDVFIIEGFCLGHRRAITRVCFTDSNDLVTCGMDGEIRLWSHPEGKFLFSCQLPIKSDEDGSPIFPEGKRMDVDEKKDDTDIIMPGLAFCPGRGMIAVSCVQSSCVGLFELNREDKSLNFLLKLDCGHGVDDVQFDSAGRLWCVGIDCGILCFECDESGEWKPAAGDFVQGMKGCVPGRDGLGDMELRPLYEDLKRSWSLGDEDDDAVEEGEDVEMADGAS